MKDLKAKILLLILILATPVCCWILAENQTARINKFIDIDTTWVDFNTVLPHDVGKFETAEEEYQWLTEANSFKGKCLDELAEASDIIEEIMYDSFDCEQKFTIDEFEEILIKKGYYRHIEKFDSLLSTQL